MAERPVFAPTASGTPLVQKTMVSFKWYPGFAISQIQKSIKSLHEAARAHIDGEILEISSKSPEELGVSLSAFNLMIKTSKGRSLSVESAFQGSKVFEGDKQFEDLYDKGSRDAKTDDRLRDSGDVITFRFNGKKWSTEPKTAFYNWLYLQALSQHLELARHLTDYAAFTDILFNPKKSLNCQAEAAALYGALDKRGVLESALNSRKRYLEVIGTADRDLLQQPRLIE